MKKFIIFIAAVFVFTSCGAPAQSTPPKDYAQIVASVLTQDEKNNFDIVTLASADSENVYDMLLIEKDSIADFALAISYISKNAFCTGVFKSAPDKQDEVFVALTGYLQAQIKNTENYLPDQVEIIKNAQVKKVGKDEIYIALGPNSDTESAAIKKLLK